MADSLDLDKMNIEAEALHQFAQGKRHILVHDYQNAVQCLEEACKLFDQKFGIAADECADAYLKYGHALLELHRQETGALDGLINPNPASSAGSDEEDEEDEENLEDEEDAKETKEEEKNGKDVEEDVSVSPTPVETNDEKTIDEKANEEKQQDSVCSSSTNGNLSTTAVAGSVSGDQQQMETDTSSAAIDPNQPSTSTGITEANRTTEEDDSEPTNLEVAYEVLKMSKDIYERQIEYNDDAHLKLSEALQRLGEILIEWENYEKALVQLEESLQIRKRILPDDDRLIAEIYYNIGLTYSLNSDIENANQNFKKAIDVIESRLNKLKDELPNLKTEELKEKNNQEIIELENILPEMKEKIEDSNDQMTTTKLATENEKLEEQLIAEKKKQILDKPISNLTHLVKRKRDTANEEENDVKKLKNGNATTENGNSVTVENGNSTNGNHAAENVEMN